MAGGKRLRLCASIAANADDVMLGMGISEILKCVGKHQSLTPRRWKYSCRLGADKLKTPGIGGGSSCFAKAPMIHNVSRFSPIWRTRDITLIPSFSFIFVIKNEETSNIFIVIDKSSE
jgi:hypothetical protein